MPREIPSFPVIPLCSVITPMPFIWLSVPVRSIALVGLHAADAWTNVSACRLVKAAHSR